VGRIRCPDAIASGVQDYVFHPAMLDSCFQVLLGTGPDGGEATFLPVAIGAFRLHRPPVGTTLWCHARVSREGPSVREAELLIFSDAGEVVAEVRGFKLQRLPNPRSADHPDLDRCLFELSWFPKRLTAGAPARRAHFVPQPSKLTAHLASLDAAARFQRRQHYEEVEPAIDRLCALYAGEALSRLGFRPRRNQKVSLDRLARRLDIAAEQRANLSRLLEILAEDGFLEASGEGWRVREWQTETDAENTARTIVERYPAYESTIRTVAGCGSQLHEILGGRADPRQLLFPEGSVEALYEFYKDSAATVVYNFLIAECVREVVRALPRGRTLRVLEIGAGTGGTAAHVVSVLPPGRSEYLFTDVSNAFISAARQRFRDYPFVDYAILDIEEDPEGQRFAPHSFDLILAADVLHATRSLRETLTHVRALLSSGGLLIALEFLRSLRFLDITFGGLKDWWRFADFDLRPTRPWLSETGWQAVLAECGFTECGIAVDSEGRWPSSQAVLLARGPRLSTRDAAGLPSATDAPGTWVVFADAGGCGRSLTDALASRGDAVFQVRAGDAFARLDRHRFLVRPDGREDLQAVLEAVAAEPGTCRGVVHLWSLDAAPAQDHAADLDRAQDLSCLSVIHLVQGLSRVGAFGSARVWLVSRGAQRIGVESTAPSPWPAMLWGLGRVVMNEHVRLRTTLVDLDPDAGAAEAQPLLRELLADDIEQEIALRGDERFVARVVGLPELRPDGAAAPARAGRTPRLFHVDVSRPGALDSVGLHESAPVKPRPGEVEIQVEAAGLNFRDVMKAAGLYPTEAPDWVGLGDECAGRVVRVGKGVCGLRPGDEVVAVAPACFSSRVRAASHHVAPKPARLAFEQAAASPIAFLTAHYALNHVARLTAGERVLIHAAAGGVGLAALQVARRAGAEVFATAGSPEKRALLSSLGVEHVMDSRSLAFVEETLSATGGEGVDVVLNSLAGEYIPKSLSVLRPTGRFLELGKVDFYQNAKLGLWPFRCGLSFCAVDLAWLLRHRPARTGELLVEVMRMFEEGSLHPLPVRVFPVSEAAAAFRLMAQARHVGKIVLSLREQPATVAARPPKKRLIRDDASYLITGGLGGFGLAMAAWMVESGARHLVLAGRGGIRSDEAERAVRRMADSGVEVVVRKVDVGREDEIGRLLGEIDDSMPPLRGVLHAAMVLDDGFLLQLDGERLRRVTGPKVNGAWNLHRLTLGRKLDFFVLFSSIASWIGKTGQANYAAANAFLDALAHHRQARNLPALTVNWGALSGTGFVARNPEIETELRRQGLLSLDPAEAGALLGRLLSGDRCEVGAARFDLGGVAALSASSGLARRFANLLSARGDDAARGPDTRAQELLTSLRSAAPEARLSLLEGALRAEVSRILAIPAAQVDADQPLADLGLDSLMSVELENVVESLLHVDLPLGFLVGEKVSLRQLSRRLLDQSPVASEPIVDAAAPAG
jgi:NADPH:quinone reductase-like Zn-dependent oxidoreductase/SAM-dependent methyltransferase/short-subunit dehydrogenase/acyl carrier protein